MRCEVCELLSRDTSNKESEIISRPWDAVTAEETHLGFGQYAITHEFQYRHDPGVTYNPSNSIIKEAAAHAKKVIRKAAKQGSLPILDKQVQKMNRWLPPMC